MAAKADSLAHTTLQKGIVMVDPYAREPIPARVQTGDWLSWVVGILTLLFCVAGLRYKSNTRYLRSLLRSATEIRERNNMFDDTVREQTIMILMLLLGSGSMGLLLWSYLTHEGIIGGGSAEGLWSCLGCVVCYVGVMPLLYRGFGNVFSTTGGSREWTRGFTAGIALTALPEFVAALLALYSDEGAWWAIIFGGLCFVMVKLLFIWRAFTIFMKESSSWVLFLYYLCNLELVPLTLTFGAAVYLSTN